MQAPGLKKLTRHDGIVVCLQELSLLHQLLVTDEAYPLITQSIEYSSMFLKHCHHWNN